MRYGNDGGVGKMNMQCSHKGKTIKFMDVVPFTGNCDIKNNDSGNRDSENNYSRAEVYLPVIILRKKL